MNKEKLFCLIFSHYQRFNLKQSIFVLNCFKGNNYKDNTSFNKYNLSSSFQENIKQFKIFKNKFNLKKILEVLKLYNIKFCTIFEKEYPFLLKQINNPPIIIYYKGNLPTNNNCLAVIGSRANSKYGYRVCKYLLKEINNIYIVSGLARGIDSIAHKEALKNNLKTIAILGSSLVNSEIYPIENKNLFENIIENGGAVISEYPPHQRISRFNFVARNRIISGLSKAVLIIEGKKKSGTLITAKFALEQNRDVLAVPGNIFDQNSYTPNYLISEGAIVVKSSKDINNIFYNT